MSIRSIFDLHDLLYNKEKAIEFFQERGVLAREMFCDLGHPMSLNLRDKGDRWRCHFRTCRFIKLYTVNFLKSGISLKVAYS